MEPPITSVTDPSPATQSPQVVEPSQTLESEQILESPPELHHHHQDQMEVDLNPLNPLPPPKDAQSQSAKNLDNEKITNRSYLAQVLIQSYDYKSARLNCKKEDWPSELTGENNESVIVSTVVKGSERSSEISLRRTLKKCNLRSIDPKKDPECKIVGKFAYNFPVMKNSLQTLLLNISKNWISVENSKIDAFLIEVFDKEKVINFTFRP